MKIEDMHDAIRNIVISTLSSEDERGGPMQRQYPMPVIESMADSIAAQVMDTVEGSLN